MNSPPPIVIIGAGLAGAACAYELVQTGHRRVLIVERAARSGQHGSAQNAGLIRSHASNPFTAAVARSGAAWWGSQELVPFEASGSVLIGGRSGELMAGFRPKEHRWLTACQSYNLVGHPLPPKRRAFFNPADGVGDPAALVDALLGAAQEHGAQLRVNCTAQLDGETLWLDGERQPFDHLVIAAGAWSAELLALPVQAFARHLVLHRTKALRAAPWVWDLDEELYWRPHPEGLLLSACDERVVHRPDPEQWPAVVDEALEELERKLGSAYPGLLPLEVLESWSGLRVLTPDDGFILGPDPRRARVLWCTALGGHGVTCCVPAAQLALQAITGRPLDADQLRNQRAHSAERFATLDETWHG